MRGAMDPKAVCRKRIGNSQVGRLKGRGGKICGGAFSSIRDALAGRERVMKRIFVVVQVKASCCANRAANLLFTTCFDRRLVEPQSDAFRSRTSLRRM